MISILPSHSETIVTSLEASDVTARLQKATANTVQWDQEFKMAADKIFYGYVQEKHFQVALRNMRLFSFNPLVQGRVEKTHNGSILFLEYQLFIMTRVLLVFWSVFAVVAALAVFYYQVNFWFGAMGLLLVSFIHLIAWANFKLQLKPTKEAIFKLLDG